MFANSISSPSAGIAFASSWFASASAGASAPTYANLAGYFPVKSVENWDVPNSNDVSTLFGFFISNWFAPDTFPRKRSSAYYDFLWDLFLFLINYGDLILTIMTNCEYSFFIILLLLLMQNFKQL